MKKFIVGWLATHLSLNLLAWHFLYHLPADRIIGSKKKWWLVTTFVDIAGPIWFLCRGIDRH